ncbi:MAG: YraN family protein [bacterium]|nr:YraN family protein [bacterium]
MREKKDLGDLGEKIAEKFLKDKGYKILDKNFRYSNFGELDIIASKDNPSSAKAASFAEVASATKVESAGKNVVFFEVKTRKMVGLSDFLPEDNITRDKQKKLIKLAEIYLSKNKINDVSWQIDILAIEVYRDGSYDIRHTENAIGNMW